MSEQVKFISSDLDKPQWTIRRTIIIVVLLWCAGIITYLTGWGQSDTLREAIAQSVLLLMGMVISTYVLGVVWSDMGWMKNSRSTPPGNLSYDYSMDYNAHYAGGRPPPGNVPAEASDLPDPRGVKGGLG